jgi:hypothetical protein
VNPTAKTIYVPPRPNLGPDPLVESPPWAGTLLAFALVVSAFLAWRLRRRKPTPPATQDRRSMPEAGSDSPRERMIAWSISLRESMAGTFGSAWLAKTTEEIADDPILLATIGPEHAARLVAFLADADRAKFANSLELETSTMSEPELTELADIIAKAVPKTGNVEGIVSKSVAEIKAT